MRTHINPYWALGNQPSLSAVLQLRCNKSKHIFATTQELETSCIVNVGLCFIEALLRLISD